MKTFTEYLSEATDSKDMEAFLKRRAAWKASKQAVKVKKSPAMSKLRKKAPVTREELPKSKPTSEVRFGDIIKYNDRYYFRGTDSGTTRHRDGTTSYQTLDLDRIKDDVEYEMKRGGDPYDIRIAGVAQWANTDDIQKVVKKNSAEWKKLTKPYSDVFKLF